MEFPYKDHKEGSQASLRVSHLKAILDKLPEDYEITYDMGCGFCFLEDLAIDHDEKKVIVNA